MSKITIGFKVEESEKERLEHLADSEGISLSDLVRKLIKKGLEESILESDIQTFKQHLFQKIDILNKDMIWQKSFSELLSKNIMKNIDMHHEFLNNVEQEANVKLKNFLREQDE
jgi:predicted HicB family RNase H-like nuclease